MRTIQPDLTEELLRHFGDPPQVAKKDGFVVGTFRELVEQTAKLSFKNKDHLLFYRGQGSDYKTKAGSSTFYPSIYRGDYLPQRELINRFDILEGASKALTDLFTVNKIEGHSELRRRKYIQWSILQHYEVCGTPLLDFTHSLRVACSFATLDNSNKHAYVYVFGLPYLTNRISINSEHDLVNIRLLSICPPTALRPYFQEGYLTGTDEITSTFDNKTELDFKNRLIAKFKIPNTAKFWGTDFNQIPRTSLYPSGDPILELCLQIRDIATKELQVGDLGEFLKSWAELEDRIVSTARLESQRFLSMREAIRFLFENGKISEDLLHPLEGLRKFRNTVVHKPTDVTQRDLRRFLELLELLKNQLRL